MEPRIRAAALAKELRYTDALAVYAQILNDDPTDLSSMKHCIALRRAAGEVDGAQALLTQMLATFPADNEAWLEAADLALSRGDLEAAAFAFEELLLASPENHHILTRYAEVLFSLGSNEQRSLARHYFALSLELCPTSLRALYGLHLSAHAALLALPRTAKDKERTSVTELLRWTSTRITEIQKSANSSAACTRFSAAVLSTLSTGKPS